MKFKYFNIDEFKCPCCGENLISKELVKKLDEARELAGVPFKVNSGYRCEKHNAKIGGSSTSSHLLGLAVDIAVTGSVDRFKILDALLRVGFTRVGVAKSFIHADIDKGKVQPVLWTY
jgi:uncharacterized protein YcbK (DUF882 family)